MNKPIDTFSTMQINTRTKIPLLVASTFCAVAFLSHVNFANAATQADCGKASAAVTQTFTANLPADPQRAKTALKLKQQGELSCRQGDVESGKSKLNKAAELLNPSHVVTDVSSPKGESHE